MVEELGANGTPRLGGRCPYLPAVGMEAVVRGVEGGGRIGGRIREILLSHEVCHDVPLRPVIKLSKWDVVILMAIYMAGSKREVGQGVDRVPGDTEEIVVSLGRVERMVSKNLFESRLRIACKDGAALGEAVESVQELYED